MLWSDNCQSPTHTTVWVHSNLVIKSKLSFSSTLVQGKLSMKACYTVKSHLTRPQTLTAVKVSKEQPPPCPVLLTHHSELALSLGCLAKQALTASPLHFERPQWLQHGLRLCSSENFSSYLLANSLRYQGPNAWNSVKTRLMTLDLLSLAHRMPFWRETRR